MKTITEQIVHFAAVGVLATLTHVVVGIGLHVFGQASPLTSNLVAFVSATLLSCIGNWLWTFEKRTPLTLAGPRFLVLALFCLCINQAIVFAFTEVVGLSYVLALVPIVTLVPALSFWISRTRVFVDAGDCA